VDFFAVTGHEVVSGHLNVARKWRVAFGKSVEYGFGHVRMEWYTP